MIKNYYDNPRILILEISFYDIKINRNKYIIALLIIYL